MRDPAHESYRRVDTLPWRNVDGEIVVVDPRQHRVHVLNETASRMWEFLDHEHTVEDLTHWLEAEGSHEDVDVFLHDLGSKGLIEKHHR
jgi:hypothetical protein